MARIIDFKKYFSHLIERNRLSHAYLFFGENDPAIRRLTQFLAAFIEKKEWRVSDDILVDAIFAEGETVGIDETREWNRRLVTAPLVSPRRILTVYHADQLTLPAMHAMLKLVEEPPETALIIFAVRHPEAILPTLASRFQKIFVSEPISIKNDIVSSEAAAYAARILEARTPKERSEAMKEMIEVDIDLQAVARAIFGELKKDVKKNVVLIRELLSRWALINEYNVNKRLQLEAAFAKSN